MLGISKRLTQLSNIDQTPYVGFLQDVALFLSQAAGSVELLGWGRGRARALVDVLSRQRGLTDLLHRLLGSGGRGVLLALVLQGCGGTALLQDAIVKQRSRGGIGVRGLDTVGLAGGQSVDDGLGTAQLDGSVEDVVVQLQMAFHGLGQVVGAGGDGPLAGAAHGSAWGLDEGISADGGGGPAKVDLGASAIVLAPVGEDGGHEVGHVF